MLVSGVSTDAGLEAAIEVLYQAIDKLKAEIAATI